MKKFVSILIISALSCSVPVNADNLSSDVFEINPSWWAYDIMTDAYDNNYIEDIEKPNGYAIRQASASILIRMLQPDTELNTEHQDISTVHDFTDILECYLPDLSIAYNLDLITGYLDNTIRPDSYIRRDEWACVLNKILTDDEKFLHKKLPEPLINDVVFGDVDDTWAQESIYNCAKYGLISGYPDGTFKPNNYITYPELIVTIQNLLNYKSQDEVMQE